jgi:hypothetical protein
MPLAAGPGESRQPKFPSARVHSRGHQRIPMPSGVSLTSLLLFSHLAPSTPPPTSRPPPWPRERVQRSSPPLESEWVGRPSGAGGHHLAAARRRRARSGAGAVTARVRWLPAKEGPGASKARNRREASLCYASQGSPPLPWRVFSSTHASAVHGSSTRDERSSRPNLDARRRALRRHHGLVVAHRPGS